VCELEPVSLGNLSQHEAFTLCKDTTIFPLTVVLIAQDLFLLHKLLIILQVILEHANHKLCAFLLLLEFFLRIEMLVVLVIVEQMVKLVVIFLLLILENLEVHLIA